jgi:hypothetical protein
LSRPLSPRRERVRVRGKNIRHPHLYSLSSRERKWGRVSVVGDLDE